MPWFEQADVSKLGIPFNPNDTIVNGHLATVIDQPKPFGYQPGGSSVGQRIPLQPRFNGDGSVTVALPNYFGTPITIRVNGVVLPANAIKPEATTGEITIQPALKVMSADDVQISY